MISTRTKNVFALAITAGFTIAATAPLQAAPDPVKVGNEATAPATATVKLNRRALAAVWCVNTAAENGGEAKKECKSRKKWIAEGRDPFAKN